MFDRASKKLGLDRAILNAPSLRESGRNILNSPLTAPGAGTTEVTPGQKPQSSGREVDSLLRNGAYGIFNDDDDESRSFCEADIDKVSL